MQNLINRFVAKRRDLVVNSEDVKDILLLLNDNLSIWRQGIRVGDKGGGKWYVSVLATNNEWDVIIDQIKLGEFKHVMYYRKGFYRI